jgi:ABC-2 type transport system permease protein
LLIGFADFRSNHTAAEWLGGWALRLVFQVVFFASAGLLVGGDETVRYMAVGNALAVGVIESATSVLALGWERASGRLALMVATPGNHVAALLARQGSAPFQGLLSSTVVFLVVWGLFRLPVPGPSALLLLPVALLTFVSVYCYGLLIGVAVIRRPSAGWAALNVSYLLLMTFCGVNVAPGFWPGPITTVAQVLPVTHGIEAFRGLLAGRPLPWVVAQSALELLVGMGWLAAAVLVVRAKLAADRRAGTLDFGG